MTDLIAVDFLDFTDWLKATLIREIARYRIAKNYAVKIRYKNAESLYAY
jgi:hypothetical protein